MRVLNTHATLMHVYILRNEPRVSPSCVLCGHVHIYMLRYTRSSHQPGFACAFALPRVRVLYSCMHTYQKRTQHVPVVMCSADMLSGAGVSRVWYSCGLRTRFQVALYCHGLCFPQQCHTWKVWRKSSFSKFSQGQAPS